MPPGQRTQAWDGGVYFKPSASLDAFGRLRVSDPVTLFESQAQYGDDTLFWETLTNAGGSVTNSLADSSVLLSTGGTTSGAYAYRQTRTHFRYHPGKSQAVVLTFVMVGGGVTNNRRRIGYFNASDGIYLQLSGSTISLVRRYSTSGAPQEEVVAQTSWSVDKLRGDGPSGKTLDITKVQILVIDLQWLGAGTVRVGFEIDGSFVECHRFNHANLIATPYMTTANLPIRAESENTGVTGGAAVIKQICSTIYSEGGADEEFGRQFSCNRGAAALSISGRRPVLSIRAKSAGPNSVTNTGQILPREASVMCASNSVLLELVLNGTLGGGGPSWTAISASQSIVEYDVAATTIANGIVIASTMVASGGAGPLSAAGEGSLGFFRQFPLVRTGLNSVQDILSVVLTPVTGNSDVWAAMTWQEML